jgi:hypothetical protein
MLIWHVTGEKQKRRLQELTSIAEVTSQRSQPSLFGYGETIQKDRRISCNELAAFRKTNSDGAIGSSDITQSTDHVIETNLQEGNDDFLFDPGTHPLLWKISQSSRIQL